MSRRFRRAFTETICLKQFTNRHNNGHTSSKQQREKDSKLRHVEHRNWVHNHHSYTSDQNGLSRHADIDEIHQNPEMNGINTPDDSSNCAFTNNAESTQQTSYMCKAKTGSKCSSIQGRKNLHMAIMTGKSKNKDLGIYV